MAEEIEKKYLIEEEGIRFDQSKLLDICGDIYNAALNHGSPLENSGAFIRQGYLSLEQGNELALKLGLQFNFPIAEARLRAKGNRYFFTLKGEGTLSRQELEKEIAQETFESNWALTKRRRIEKIRLAILLLLLRLQILQKLLLIPFLPPLYFKGFWGL